MRALILAVRDHLRKELALQEGQIAAHDGPEPEPMCGELFVSVHQGSRRIEYCEGRNEVFGIQVTVTRRITFAPQDRVEVPLFGPDGEALEKVVDAVAAKLHMDPPATGETDHHPVRRAANVIIGSSANGFVEPLQLANIGLATTRGPEWFSAEPDSGRCGLSQTLTFDGARRVQTVESQT